MRKINKTTTECIGKRDFAELFFPSKNLSLFLGVRNIHVSNSKPCHIQLISFEYTTPCISQKVFGSFLKWEIDFESEVAFGRFVMKGKDNIEG